MYVFLRMFYSKMLRSMLYVIVYGCKYIFLQDKGVEMIICESRRL